MVETIRIRDLLNAQVHMLYLQEPSLHRMALERAVLLKPVTCRIFVAHRFVMFCR
jgi:hypothetical protein